MGSSLLDFTTNGITSAFLSLFFTKKRGLQLFKIHFPFPSSNNPSASAYGVYVSQLIRYATACVEYQDYRTRKSAHYETVDSDTKELN